MLIRQPKPKPHSFQVGDTVLVRQKRVNKLSSPYNKHPYTIVKIKGSMITARNATSYITRNSSQFKKITITTHQQDHAADPFDDELWIQIQHKKLRSILLCVCYRPPDCPVSCFTNNFMAEYTRALIYGKDILVVGDLNCNLLKTTQEAEALRDICCSLNLVQLIDKPTRVTLQSSSLIDVIMTSSESLIVKSGVVEVNISDHFLVSCELN